MRSPSPRTRGDAGFDIGSVRSSPSDNSRLRASVDCESSRAAPERAGKKRLGKKLDSIDARERGNQFAFRIAFEIPVYDFLSHHYVDAVVRETRKKEVEDQKPHVADTAPHTLFR